MLQIDDVMDLDQGNQLLRLTGFIHMNKAKVEIDIKQREQILKSLGDNLTVRNLRVLLTAVMGHSHPWMFNNRLDKAPRLPGGFDHSRKFFFKDGMG